MSWGGSYGATSWKPKKTFTNLTVGKTYIFPMAYYGSVINNNLTKNDFSPSTGIEVLNVASFWSGVYQYFYYSFVLVFKATSTTAEIQLSSTLNNSASWLLGDGLVQLD